MKALVSLLGHLNEKGGIPFHNKDPLPSENVEYTLERIVCDESLRENSHYKQIKEMKFIDE